MSKFIKNSRNFAKIDESRSFRSALSVGRLRKKKSEIGEKFNRKIQYFNPVLGDSALESSPIRILLMVVVVQMPSRTATLCAAWNPFFSAYVVEKELWKDRDCTAEE